MYVTLLVNTVQAVKGVFKKLTSSSKLAGVSGCVLASSSTLSQSNAPCYCTR